MVNLTFTLSSLLVLLVLSADPAHANLFFSATTDTAATALGSNTGASSGTVRCAALDAPGNSQSVPVGLIIHSRNDFFFGSQVSAVELICRQMDDALISIALTVAPLAGRTNDGGIPGSPYLRHCPTGQVLTGIEGRAGLNVDAITITCAEVNPNQLTGAVSKGQTFAIGTPIWGAGGADDSSSCGGQTFVRAVTVSFDDVLRRLNVRCGALAVTPLGAANLTAIRLHATTRNQRVVFSDNSADGFSLSVVNRGRSIAAGEASVRLRFSRASVAVTAPAGCTLQIVTASQSDVICNLPALVRGGRALISGLQVQPLQILAPMSQVGTVQALLTNPAAGTTAAASPISVLFPNILWP